MYYVPNVPLIPQAFDMSCWFASAEMVISWRRGRTQTTEIAHPTPRTVPGLAQAVLLDDGLSTEEITRLARKLGLVDVPPTAPTLMGVQSLLRQYGPLWFAGIFRQMHAVVITGVDHTGVQINDPAPVGIGRRRTLTPDEFGSVMRPLPIRGSSAWAPNILHCPR